jgi:hypothetical protein
MSSCRVGDFGLRVAVGLSCKNTHTSGSSDENLCGDLELEVRLMQRCRDCFSMSLDFQNCFKDDNQNIGMLSMGPYNSVPLLQLACLVKQGLMGSGQMVRFLSLNARLLVSRAVSWIVPPSVSSSFHWLVSILFTFKGPVGLCDSLGKLHM